jgi:hypothetical protein
MSFSSEDQPIRWLRMLRRAYLIPDDVAAEHVNEIIARHLLKAHPSDGVASGNVPEPFADSLTAAIGVVQALRSVAISGALDLPLCGFGAVTGPSVNNTAMQADSADKTAEASIAGALGEEHHNQRAVWVAKIWKDFSSYVQSKPYDD